MYTVGSKFHGMTIVSDDDCITPRNRCVLEMNSNNECVLRSYDSQMNEIGRSEIDLFGGIRNGKMSESNCTGAIKRQVGMNSILISMSAVERILEITDGN